MNVSINMNIRINSNIGVNSNISIKINISINIYFSMNMNVSISINTSINLTLNMSVNINMSITITIGIILNINLIMNGTISIFHHHSDPLPHWLDLVFPPMRAYPTAGRSNGMMQLHAMSLPHAKRVTFRLAPRPHNPRAHRTGPQEYRG
jgi:hypothetical protein